MRPPLHPSPAALAAPVPGGATRQASVLWASRHWPARASVTVLIHDAARPFLSADLIDRVIAALEGNAGAIAAEPVSDTLKRAGADGTIARHRRPRWPVARADAASLPLRRHSRCASPRRGAGRPDFTDDAALAEWAGLPVKLVASSSRNIKLTTAAGSRLADSLLGTDGHASRATARASTCTASRPATTSGCAGSRSPYPPASKATPMPTSGCMHSPTRCWAPSATATSASIFRRVTRHGAAPPRASSWTTRRRACARWAGASANVDVTFLCEAPQGWAPSPCHARGRRRHPRHRHRARRHQGDDDGRPGLHRPRRRHRRHGQRHRVDARGSARRVLRVARHPFDPCDRIAASRREAVV